MNKIGYREFIVGILKLIDEYETKDFKNLIITMALKKSSDERGEFLNFLNKVLCEDEDLHLILMKEISEKATTNSNCATCDPSLVDGIQNLHDRIYDGEYDGSWEWDPYEHEERMMADESWAEDVFEFFCRTKDAFVACDYKTAAKAYRLLFSILKYDGLPCLGNYEEAINIDEDEQRFLFLRAVYMATDLKERASQILEELESGPNYFARSFKLNNLKNSDLKELPDFQEFLVDWINVLGKSDFYFKHDFLREAVYLDGGIEGLREFARKNYKKIPELYLDWVVKLEEVKSTDREIIEGCREGLSKISSNDKVRDPLAKVMIRAAKNCNESSLIITGIKDAYQANLNIENAVLLIYYSIEYGYNMLENINFAINTIKSSQKEDDNLLFKLYILSGQISNAFDLVKAEGNGKPLLVGWSYSDVKTPEFIAVLFFFLSKENRVYSKIINRMWNEHLDRVYFTEKEINIRVKYEEILDNAMKNTVISDKEKLTLIKWCKDMTLGRVNSIVSNQHRGAYDRAAEVLLACSEMIANIEGESQAYEFIYQVKEKYPRHTSFTKSVNNAVKEANITQKFL